MAKEEVSAEVSKSLRNFRNTDEVENFYRFVHEYGLRREAKLVLDHLYNNLLRKPKRRKKSTKLQ